MNIYLMHIWNKLKSSLWLIPTLMTILAFFLSILTLNLDRSEIVNLSIWQGGDQGSRNLLSTIAGSMITMTGVVFSITTVALALTSNQYGSSLLPSFMQNWGTQVVLGTFISTSIYTLLILRTIGASGVIKDVFVPHFSIALSIGLAILSLSMLIYFIQHLSTTIQASNIIARVAQNLIKYVESLKDRSEEINANPQVEEERTCTQEITATITGYLQVIDYNKLIDLSKNNQFSIEIDIRAGHFIRKEMVLARVNCILNKEVKKSIASVFIIGKERSPTQDLEYGIKQLVIIALRALSKETNDTSTVNTCVDYLGATFCILCQKDLTPFNYKENPNIRLLSRQQTFEGLLNAAFNEIRQFGSNIPSVLIHVLETLISILFCSQTEEQRNSLKMHVVMIEHLGNDFLEKKDKEDLQERVDHFNRLAKKLSSQ